MSNDEELLEFPCEYFESVINDVIKQENIKDFTFSVTSASGKGENYMGVICRIRVTGKKENGENTKLSIIMKIPPQSAMLREKFPMEPVYIKEVFVYNTMLPELCALEEKYNVPKSERFQRVKCFKASSEQSKEYLVLQDIREEGFRMANRRETLGPKHLKLVLKSMASFHALSFVFKRDNPETFLEFVNSPGGLKNFETLKPFMEVARQKALGGIADKAILERVDKFTANMADVVDMYVDPESAGQYNVLCHGDFWNNNLLFKFEGDEPVDVRLLDWQISRYCSPITDIAYLIFTGTDYGTRKKHFKYLMNYYHQCLGQKLGYMDCDVEEAFPKAVFEEHLKKLLTYGLFMSFLLLPAVLGEAEDVADMDVLLLKETIELGDIQFVNKESANRFTIRMTGVCQTFIDMGLI